MLVKIQKNYKELSEKAAEILIKEISKNPSIVICFATGSTPPGMYKKLVLAYKKKKIRFSGITSFNLDEYYKIKRKDKNSYCYYMHKILFDKINIKNKNINFLNGEAKNYKKECENYEKKINDKPIDIQILGVGVNGHIAFNEPGSKFNSKTRLVRLSQETIKANSRFFKNKKSMPKKALTMGISTIKKAKKIILLASGEKKAEAIFHLVKGNLDEKWPLTSLKNHNNLVVIIDKKAASLILKKL
ncbi:glucosamine-6-phosphate deaminase [Candidatus Pacearchaeota archaeon]|nr:glucosamine-6-phosphate deaminase [Candidatus Pacearchaeota archaeon]